MRPQTADPPKHSSTLTSFNATCTGIDETTPGEEEDIDEVVGVTPGDKEVVQSPDAHKRVDSEDKD